MDAPKRPGDARGLSRFQIDMVPEDQSIATGIKNNWDKPACRFLLWRPLCGDSAARILVRCHGCTKHAKQSKQFLKTHRSIPTGVSMEGVPVDAPVIIG